MKKSFLILVVLAWISSSCTQQKNGSQSNTTELTEKKGDTVNSKDPYYGKVRKITTDEFKKLIFNFEQNPQVWAFKGKKPCVIDFYADWCRPCKIISPILDELALEYAGKVDFYKVDTQTETDVAQAFGVKSIPLVIYCGVTGSPQGSEGALSKEQYKNFIEQMLKK